MPKLTSLLTVRYFLYQADYSFTHFRIYNFMFYVTWTICYIWPNKCCYCNPYSFLCKYFYFTNIILPSFMNSIWNTRYYDFLLNVLVYVFCVIEFVDLSLCIDCDTSSFCSTLLFVLATSLHNICYAIGVFIYTMY